jgi:hypothetical protein
MGLVRYGDPAKFPDTDVMVRRGIRYELDTIWTSAYQARQRESQLEKTGNTVYVLDRYAPPEEVMQHLHVQGDASLEIPYHIDGRYTHVWDVWVARKRITRVKKSSKPKTKRISMGDSLISGTLNVTKAAVIGSVGIGVMGGVMGAVMRKKRRGKSKVKCRCK